MWRALEDGISVYGGEIVGYWCIKVDRGKKSMFLFVVRKHYLSGCSNILEATWIVFIFAQCHRSRVVMTPIKYQCNVQCVHTVLIFPNNWDNNERKTSILQPSPSADTYPEWGFSYMCMQSLFYRNLPGWHCILLCNQCMIIPTGSRLLSFFGCDLLPICTTCQISQLYCTRSTQFSWGVTC